MISAFDADVLIYAAVPGHPLGSRVLPLIKNSDPSVGSVLLLPEILTKPLRADPDSEEVALLFGLVSRIELFPFDQTAAEFAVGLGSKYGLRAADAAYLATAIMAGADQFITNNRKDFPKTIAEIEVVYPDELSVPAFPQ